MGIKGAHLLSCRGLCIHQESVTKDMSICPFCKALKWVGEFSGSNETICLPGLQNTLQPFLSLFLCQYPDLQQFIQKIWACNSAFQMTIFGHKPIFEDSYVPTFQIQDHSYYQIGSILPVNNAEHWFLQIYFMGDTTEQKTHCAQVTRGAKWRKWKLLKPSEGQEYFLVFILGCYKK